MPASAARDAVIVGGGLAGLTLALQLRGRFPELDILVLERQRHPLPAAAHKVGESTVEIGAHYLDTVLGLREHMDTAQIRKFGLRYFFSDGCEAIAEATELGVSRPLPLPSYQIDRGLFENFLGEEARRRGIEFRDGASVRGLDVGEGGAVHTVHWREDDGEHAVQARWLLDASGRAGLLRRRFELTRDNGHAANAVWFRTGQRIAIDDWCDDADWQGRCDPPERWRSTNHLMGPGYWAWLIPLASGAHSVGIVCDAGMHPLEAMRDYQTALAWLGQRQPALARAVAATGEAPLDFRFLRGYSYTTERLFSADRWALTGEAGSFLDPFYSPGTDFIGINNSYIVALLAHDLAGEHLSPWAHFYEQLFFSLYEGTLRLFRGQYPLFGNARVMPLKITWDYAYYWGVLCPLVFGQRLTDLKLMAAVRPSLLEAQALNQHMQARLRDWHAEGGGRSRRRMLDQCALPWFMELNARIAEPLDDAALLERLRGNVALLSALADGIAARAGATGAAPAAAHPPLFATA
ncbi:MAG TPA: NAD(P)/FAD-dependent oxidoreductase [Rhodanobacteraceae bacterium]|nr:NAD(P)/FAD-dependent oxidoreductase [Rhodanobacteraceae bacterium]